MQLKRLGEIFDVALQIKEKQFSKEISEEDSQNKLNRIQSKIDTEISVLYHLV